jgi:hypothetical protein
VIDHGARRTSCPPTTSGFQDQDAGASGVYRQYADKHLKPEQIDEVDIASYLRTGAPA